MILPVEVLFMIASNLDTVDLRNFRLAHSYFSNLSTPLIARNGISVMDTAESLKDLRKLFSMTEIADQIRKLTIYFGEWPVCIRPSEWKTHYLLYGHGISNKKLLRTRGRCKTDQAFSRYSAFIAEEQGRESRDDIETIIEAMVSLKKLGHIVISDMQKWALYPPKLQKYKILQDRIWMAPCTVTSVAAGVQTFLLAFMRLPAQHGIKELSIEGAFDPACISLGPGSPYFSGIRLLQVTSFAVNHNQHAIWNFLQLFPDLVHLLMSFQGRHFLIDLKYQGPKLFSNFFCATVETLDISGLRISEDGLLGIVGNYCKSLRSFTIGSSAITFGSWRSFFTQIRRQYPHLYVKAEGKLFEQVIFREVLNFTHIVASDMLENFMKDKNMEWPFV